MKNNDDEISGDNDNNMNFIFKKSTPKKSFISSTGFKESKESSKQLFSISPPKLDDIDKPDVKPLPQEKDPLDFCTNIPVDWTIRSLINIISPSDISNDVEMDITKSISQFLNYYTYPSEPLSASIVHQFRRSNQLKDETSLFDYWKMIRDSWSECINSLKELIQNNEVPFFYILYKSFSVFSLYNIGDHSLIVVVNNSTEKFRKKLSSKNVTYEMPYYNPEKHKNLSFIDEQTPSLLIIKGVSNFNHLMDTLIEEVLADDQTVIHSLPMIISSHPFVNSCKKKNKLSFGKIRKLNTSNEYDQGFYLEVDGFILPNDTMNIINQIKLKFDSFDVKFENIGQTKWLNAVNSFLSHPYIQHVTLSLIDKCIDGFDEIKKVTYENNKNYKIKTTKR